VRLKHFVLPSDEAEAAEKEQASAEPDEDATEKAQDSNAAQHDAKEDKAKGKSKVWAFPQAT
jgi:hypothetical protein